MAENNSAVLCDIFVFGRGCYAYGDLITYWRVKKSFLVVGKKGV